MKLSWKIFFSTFLISILTFSLGGYFLISAVFKSAFERESGLALEENKMLRSYFRAVIPMALSKEQDKVPIANIVDIIICHFANDKLSIRVFADSRDLIAQSCDINFDIDFLNRLDDDSLACKTIESEGNYFVQSASVINTFSGKIYLETIHDISSIFKDRQSLFSFYRKLIFSLLLVNGLIVFSMTLYTLAPLNRLSTTTREIAKGKYGNRAAIQTKDEIGLLAEDFNRMADSLENKIRDLEETTIRQRDFIGSFAHEIKTPLTSIIGYADMIRSKKMAEENRILAADYIFNEGKRLESLSLKLLNLLVVRNHEFKMKEIGLNDILNQIQKTREKDLKGKNIKLTITAEDTQVKIEIDLLKTLILNLIDNAAKAIEGDGVIRITGKRISADRFRIIVNDNGRGIPKEDLNRITEIFYMVEKSRLQNKGVGIGLSLCQEIVKLHDGEMKFESEEGMGTSVYLELRG